jgi:intracellular sulfur oxidation DsrE/DsrF family protein
MKSYVLIESQGEHEAVSARRFLAMAAQLKRQGARVEVMLVQNGVMAARAGASADALTSAIKFGVAVCADAFSLKERAIDASALAPGVTAASLGRVVERMADGWNVLWH